MQSRAATNIQQAGQSLTLSTPLQLLGAALLGAAIMYGVGFIDTPAAHNVAHDTRHSQGFPCH